MNNQNAKLPNPRGEVPIRRPGSARRTSTIDATWPEEREGRIQLHGITRDCITPEKGHALHTIGHDELFVTADSDRCITQIRSTPDRPSLQTLVGIRALKELRQQLASVIPQDQQKGAPFYSLMHDITGVVIISDWAWASRKESLLPGPRDKRRAMMAKMESACIGFHPDSSALRTDGRYQANMAAFVPPFVREDDPEGWHDLPDVTGVSMRRARWLDLWIEDDIHIESGFQDSATTEEGPRKAVHEYSVRAIFDKQSMVLKSVIATPHILPFPECPGAVKNIHRLLGSAAPDIRDQVSQTLYKTNGCTHLNDALRSLADAPALVANLTTHN